MSRERVLIVSNTAWNVRRYRMGFLRHLHGLGYELHVACGYERALERELEEIGAVLHPLPARGGGAGPFAALWLMLRLWGILLRVRPGILHLFTLGPAILGAALSRFFPNIRRVVVSLTGMGAWRRDWTRPLGRVLTALARIAWGARGTHVVVQNHDDRALLAAAGIVRAGQLSVILGSGVPASIGPFEPVPRNGKITFLMVSRMLWSKGVREFVEIGQRLAAEMGTEIEFLLVGGSAEDYAARNPDFVSRDWLMALEQSDPAIRWIGFTDPATLQTLLRRCRAVMLASTYAEGVPRSLIEALAAGRPVITLRSPGCREVVPQGYDTGFLADPGDSDALFDACRRLAQDPDLADRMGQAGCAAVRAKFSSAIVDAELAALYQTEQRSVSVAAQAQ